MYIYICAVVDDGRRKPIRPLHWLVARVVASGAGTQDNGRLMMCMYTVPFPLHFPFHSCSSSVSLSLFLSPSLSVTPPHLTICRATGLAIEISQSMHPGHTWKCIEHI